uniref:Lipopolysaccharide core heptose(I) kinase n=1 Tax=Candidatus Kentrum sp. FM TaxID=2126340 RepID=A0A450WIB1_9GAMM|nr:MAG: heptose I phosphotransferase [Candidatus Kentron sp. FM]VFJ67188.1 MAG: heptose I phosphotransferase [Candidatus Kentron sp. FM]VFK16762.1 MAG: heptose I phosphotransferase [Candidatus Kentron sp. FM]
MKIYLREEFKRLWRDADPFVRAGKLRGKVFRAQKARTTLQFESNGRQYFLKLHKGIGWPEIAKNLLQLRLPVLGAGNERRAILALTEIGVGTMSIAAFGEKGLNPAKRLSFIITDAIEPAMSLEEIAWQWRENPPDPKLKRAVLDRVCRMTRLMHEGNINHRDLYLCHFLWRGYPGQTPDSPLPDLVLIDLHRALIHKRLPYRWKVKDLAGLYYSAMDAGLTDRDRFRFIGAYSKKGLRAALTEDGALWDEVEYKAKKLYEKAIRKGILSSR